MYNCKIVILVPRRGSSLDHCRSRASIIENFKKEEEKVYIVLGTINVMLLHFHSSCVASNKRSANFSDMTQSFL